MQKKKIKGKKKIKHPPHTQTDEDTLLLLARKKGRCNSSTTERGRGGGEKEIKRVSEKGSRQAKGEGGGARDYWSKRSGFLQSCTHEQRHS